jgi:hypothetical protein
MCCCRNGATTELGWGRRGPAPANVSNAWRLIARVERDTITRKGTNKITTILISQICTHQSSYHTFEMYLVWPLIRVWHQYPSLITIYLKPHSENWPTFIIFLFHFDFCVNRCKCLASNNYDLIYNISYHKAYYANIEWLFIKAL